MVKENIHPSFSAVGTCSNLKGSVPDDNIKILHGKVLQPTHPPNEKEIDVNPLLGFVPLNQEDDQKLENISKGNSIPVSKDAVKQPEFMLSEQTTPTLSI